MYAIRPLLGSAVLLLSVGLLLLVRRVDGQDSGEFVELDGPNVCKKVEE